MNRILPALLALLLLAVPSSASLTGAPPAGAIAMAAPAAAPFDQEKFDAITEQINRYWRQTLKDDGYRYREPFAALVKDRIDTACGRIDPSVVAAYCPGDLTIYLAPEEIGKMIDEYGDFVPVVAVAHEWGHHIQTMLGVEDQKTIKMELQADCLAGAALGDAAAQGLVNKGDIKEATTLTRDALGDPEWLPRDSDQAHGSGDQRVRNLLAGYEQGVKACGLEELLSAALATPTPPPPEPTPTPEPTPPPAPTVDPNVAPPVDPGDPAAQPDGRGRKNQDGAAAPVEEPAPAEPAPAEPAPAEVPPVEETPVVVEEIPAVAEIPAAPAEPVPAEPVPAEPAPAEPAPEPAAAGPTDGTILTGRLVLDSAALQQVDGACAGTGSLADIAAGLPVVVQDVDGNDIGLGALGPGVPSADGAHCMFPFAVEGLPPSPAWSVRLGDRDPVSYDRGTLEQAGFRVAMRLAG